MFMLRDIKIELLKYNLLLLRLYKHLKNILYIYNHINKMSTTKYIDYLTEDDVLPRQQWVCLSFLSPEGIKNCSIRGIKVRGVFATREEAETRSKQLQERDPDFNVFVGEVGKWLPWDPDVNTIEDQVYANEQLNDLAKGYKENLKKINKAHEERKRDMLNNTEAKQKDNTKEHVNDDQLRADKTKERLKKKMEKRKTEKLNMNNIMNKLSDGKQYDKTTENIVDKEIEIMGHENEVKKLKDELNEEEKIINEKQNNLNNVNAQLEKIKLLYNNMKKK